MAGSLHRFLAGDHARLDGLLLSVISDCGTIDRHADRQFRGGLLRHIRMEEQVLFPFLFARHRETPVPGLECLHERLHLDHGALAALLVPTPTAPLVQMIRAILEAHNPYEEDPGGLYALCEELAGPGLDELIDRLRRVREVRLAPHTDSPRALESTREAVERAGHVWRK